MHWKLLWLGSCISIHEVSRAMDQVCDSILYERPHRIREILAHECLPSIHRQTIQIRIIRRDDGAVIKAK